jgi:hypothetical protein
MPARPTDYRHAQERQERDEARWEALRTEAEQREAAREEAVSAAAAAAETDATTGQPIPPPKAPSHRSSDEWPWLVRALPLLFALITWPLVRPILKTSPGWPRVIAAVLYWGFIAFLVIFAIRSA